MKTLLVILSCIALSCATTQSINVEKRTHVYPSPYMVTFKAALDYFSNAGYPLLQADKDLGLLNTDYKSNEGIAKFLGSDQRYKINMNLIRIGQDSTKAVANITWEKQGKFGSWEAVSITEGQAVDFYNEIFAGIDSLRVK